MKGCLLFDRAHMQPVLAQSSGESESMAQKLVLVQYILLVQSVPEQLEFSSEPQSLYLDSKVAKATVACIGVGGVRQLGGEELVDAILGPGRAPARLQGAGRGEWSGPFKTQAHPRSRFEELRQPMGLRRWDVSELKEHEVKHLEHEQSYDCMQVLSLGLRAVAQAAVAFADVVLCDEICGNCDGG